MSTDSCALSVRAIEAVNENPGALAGATGADFDSSGMSLEYRKRAGWATALCYAISECHPHDACEIMAAALADLSAGMPNAPLFNVMDEARSWASFATRADLKAYCLACFEQMPPADQAGFLSYVQRSAAA